MIIKTGWISMNGLIDSELLFIVLKAIQLSKYIPLKSKDFYEAYVFFVNLVPMTPNEYIY